MTTPQDNQPGVLHGLTVADFSANAAGPVCGMLLADFGARVIKVEPPAGDATRQWGVNRFGSRKQLTGTFMAMNRNKLGLMLDMKTEEGRRRAAALIREASPTTLALGRMLGAMAIAAIPLFAIVVVAGRWLSRRVGPAFPDEAPLDDEEEPVHDPWEDEEPPE